MTGSKIAAVTGTPEPEPHRISRDRDIILEAVNTYDQWMLDDDYDALGVLGRIMERMRERAGYTEPVASSPSLPVTPAQGSLREALEQIATWSGHPVNPDDRAGGEHDYSFGYNDALDDVRIVAERALQQGQGTDNLLAERDRLRGALEQTERALDDLEYTLGFHFGAIVKPGTIAEGILKDVLNSIGEILTGIRPALASNPTAETEWVLVPKALVQSDASVRDRIEGVLRSSPRYTDADVARVLTALNPTAETERQAPPDIAAARAFIAREWPNGMVYSDNSGIDLLDFFDDTIVPLLKGANE